MTSTRTYIAQKPRPTHAIACYHMRKTFRIGRRRIQALDDVSITIARGEMVGLIGASGSGKSTLLRHLSGLVTANHDGGSAEVLGQLVQDKGRIAKRINRVRQRVGFIFQQFNLVGRLNVITNVLIGMSPRIPLWRSLLGVYWKHEKMEAMQALHRVGIHQAAGQRASSLSGGQQQRAAIARAMVQRAEVVLADEPIASLDPVSSEKVMSLLRDMNEQDGTTVVVSLHQVEFARRYCKRIIAMRDGKVVFDGSPAQLSHQLCCDLYGAESDDAGLVDGTAPMTPNSVHQDVQPAFVAAAAS
ncbi:MAG: phosphonate ABC transporter ATP-binding protein [Planctomycetota bacterium]|nr:MAG: phosphonate ABC transporter ATP-binding protein [Planctomycetota bacterium]